MQISLRSQMIAGATAVVGASAIAITPIAPAVSLPSLSLSKASVALAAFDNPFTALLNTGLVLGNYTLNGANTVPAVNWPGSGTNDFAAGIGALVNAGLVDTGVVVPGLLPNILEVPFPAATTLLSNLLGYGFIGGAAALSAAGDVADILWSIPATALQVVVDLITLDFPAAIANITDAVAAAVVSATDAVNTLVNATTLLISSVATKGSAVLDLLLTDLSALPTIITGQLSVLTGSVTGIFQNVVSAISAPNPGEGVWNALVSGLLDATVSGSLPATVINLTYGAGVQFGPIVSADIPFVPSVRTVGTGLATGIAEALNTPVPPIAAAAPAASAPAVAEVTAPAITEVEAPAITEVEVPAVAEVKAPAAVRAAKASAAEVSTATAAAVEAAPAAEAPSASAGDNDGAGKKSAKKSARTAK